MRIGTGRIRGTNTRSLFFGYSAVTIKSAKKIGFVFLGSREGRKLIEGMVMTSYEFA